VSIVPVPLRRPVVARDSVGVALLAPSMGAAVLLIGLTLATVVAVRVVAVARTAEGVR
jgi:hypothetical protein